MILPATTLSMFRRLATAWLLLALFAAPALAQQDQATGAATATTPAQTGSGAQGSVSVQDLDSLIGTLEDDASRQKFIDDLKALVAAQKEVASADDSGSSPDLVSRIADQLSRVDVAIEGLVAELDDGSGLVDWFREQAGNPELRASWIEAIWQVAATLAVALATALVLRRLVGLQLGRLEERGHPGWAVLVPVVGFAAVAYLALMFIKPDGFARVIAVTLINATIAVRLVSVVARCLFSPLARELRPLPMSDEQAAYLFVWAGRFAVVGVYGFFAVDLMGALGLPESSAALLLRLVGLAIAAMAFVVILQSRDAVAAWIRTHPESGGGRVLRQRLADIWHVLACVAVFINFAVWALDVQGGFIYLLRGFGGTGAAVFGALLASTVLRGLLNRLFQISDEISHKFPGLDRRANRYVAVLTWVLNLAIWLIAGLVALEAWGVGVIDLFATPEGADLVARVIAIVAIAVLATVIWEMGDGMISRALARGDARTLTSRMKTLLPLFRNVLLVTVVAIAVTTAMSEIGVEIAPLLAGAGVVGLAIGFGAQTLVKYIITGAFVLFEDQFSVGDWIEAGGKSGGVESISIRTVRLRDVDGYVHTVPFGEITALTNMMRDFGYAVIDVGVAYRENTDDVIAVLREVDATAREDTAFAERLVGDFEVLGVHELGDSAVTIRTRVKTVAGFQWGVRREYLRRIKLRFDELGIEIPFPHVTVWFGEPKGGKPPPVAHVRIDAETVQDDGAEAPNAAAETHQDLTALAVPDEADRT